MPLDCTNADGAYGLIDEGILPLDSCNIFTTQTALIYLAEIICTGVTTTSNNIRCVPDGEPTGNFNSYFDGSTPDTYSIVYRLDVPEPTLWITCSGGGAWTQFATDNEFRSIDTSVTTPSDANLNALFTNGVPNTNSLVVDIDTGTFYATVNGANWNIIGTQTEFRTLDIADCATTFVDPNNPTDSELNDLFPNSSPSQSAFVYNPCNDTFYYTFDGATWNSIAISTCGLTSDIYANIVILAGASNLSVNCLYEITDVNNLASGALTGSTFIFKAVNTDNINASGYVLVPTGEIFLAIYDIATNNIVRLWDDLGNDVSGSSNISEFIWLDANWSGNTINLNSSLLTNVSTICIFQNNHFFDTTISINNFTGTLSGCEMRNGFVNLTTASGIFQFLKGSGSISSSNSSIDIIDCFVAESCSLVASQASGSIISAELTGSSTIFEVTSATNITSINDKIYDGSTLDYTSSLNLSSRSNVLTNNSSMSFLANSTTIVESNALNNSTVFNTIITPSSGTFSDNGITETTVDISSSQSTITKNIFTDSTVTFFDSNGTFNKNIISGGTTTLTRFTGTAENNKIIGTFNLTDCAATVNINDLDSNSSLDATSADATCLINNNILSDASTIDAVGILNGTMIVTNEIKDNGLIDATDADNCIIRTNSVCDSSNLKCETSIGCTITNSKIYSNSDLFVDTATSVSLIESKIEDTSTIDLTSASSVNAQNWKATGQSSITAQSLTVVTTANNIKATDNSTINLSNAAPNRIRNLEASFDSAITANSAAFTGDALSISAWHGTTVVLTGLAGVAQNVIARVGYTLTINKNLGFSITNAIYAIGGVTVTAAAANELNVAVTD
jgi:hypothetical protein